MLHLRGLPALKAWGAVLVVIAAVAGLPQAAKAQSADGFSVRNVQVDVSAANLAQARDQALAEGQRQAYQQLMQRLTASSDWPRIPQLADKDLQDIVLDVGIDQEKRSSVRYLAALSVRFKGEAIRKLLRSANLPYAEWRGRPVAVLPVYQADSGAVLFETPNPWRDIWKSPSAQGIVPMVVPVPPPADQADPALVTATVAAAAPETLAAIGQRYATQDVLVALAVPKALEGNKVKIEVILTGAGSVAALASGSRSYEGQPGEGYDAVMRRAVEDIVRSTSDSWKSGNVLSYDRPNDLPVTVAPVGGMADWTALRDRLVRVTAVRSFDIVTLSKAEAQLVLHAVGDQKQLEQSLLQNGLVLTWAENRWFLQPMQARPISAPTNR